MSRLAKIKKRLKRALAGFLRDELKEYTDYQSMAFGPLSQEVYVDTIRFDTYKMERLIDVDARHNWPIDPLSYQIQDAKREFAELVTDHIHIDIKELTDPVHLGKAAIRLTLRVQVPK